MESLFAGTVQVSYGALPEYVPDAPPGVTFGFYYYYY